MSYLIRVREYGDGVDDGPVIHEVGPFASERLAEKAEDGVNHNLDHNRYYTEIVPA